MLLFVVDERRQELALAGSKKLDADSEIKSKRGDAFDRWVLEHRRPLMIGDVAKDERSLRHEKQPTRRIGSLISAPMILEDRILGIIRLESLMHNAYTVDDLRILYVIADIAAVAVNNAHLYTKTEELAIKDGLTGLYVHRCFKERLSEEMKRAERKHYTFSVLMIDIDHFKHYNDKYGHAAGDVVLQHIARSLCSFAERKHYTFSVIMIDIDHFKHYTDKYGHAAGDVVLQHIARSLCSFAESGDVIARYGGEEFAVILASQGTKRAVKTAEGIRQHIAKDTIQLRGHQANVTVSIGVATYPRDGTHEEGLLRTADTNLYRAKREGRNKVCF
jgi:diguanylate cyclase (GGDEF)-like protein